MLIPGPWAQLGWVSVGQGSLGASPPWSRTRGSPISPASRMALLSTHPRAPLLVANPLSLSTPCQAGTESQVGADRGWVGRLFQALSPSDWAFGCGMLQPAAREPWALQGPWPLRGSPWKVEQTGGGQQAGSGERNLPGAKPRAVGSGQGAWPARASPALVPAELGQHPTWL